ncbi:MAG TPA: hypothetical protein VGL03_07410 [Thermoanaerobaculia bacterium]|jgi:hypothetical protein
MEEAIACIASSDRIARGAADDVRERLAAARIRSFSFRSYLASSGAPRRIVLCTAGRSLDEQLEFLRRARDRLLWPAPPSDFRDAIAGLRAHGAPSPEPTTLRPRLRKRGIAAALLLEGPVSATRARAALCSGAPRNWIVESAGHVRIADPLLAELACAGVRWSTLDPVELIALWAPEAFARARRWRGWLPSGTPVWIHGKRKR